MSASILFAWLGNDDLGAVKPRDDIKLSEKTQGPIAAACRKEHFDKVCLLTYDRTSNEIQKYSKWLEMYAFKAKKVVTVESLPASPNGPTDIGSLYFHADKAVARHSSPRDHVFFHLSPGNGVMVASWILLAGSKYNNATLLQSRVELDRSIVQNAAVPFEVQEDFVREFYMRSSINLEQAANAKPDINVPRVKWVAECPQMLSVLKRIERIAPYSIPILITGETGTGKELVAQEIHKRSRREGKIFAINCAAIPNDLFESELFGHEKGAFTGANTTKTGVVEAAEGGTLFLDEVGELELAQQSKILRWLQGKTFRRVGGTKEIQSSVRLIAATNRDLRKEIAAGQFREDLYYRLCCVPIHLPPVRERTNDIPHLVDHLFQEKCKELNITNKFLSKTAKRLLCKHTWPGNVREMENSITSILVLADPDQTVITPSDVEAVLIHQVYGVDSSNEEIDIPNGFSLDEEIKRIRRKYVKSALEKSNGVKTKAAGLLGFKSYQALDRWL